MPLFLRTGSEPAPAASSAIHHGTLIRTWTELTCLNCSSELSKKLKGESVLATIQIARGGTPRADLTVPFSIVAYLTATDTS
jgi:hypothetical protein